MARASPAPQMPGWLKVALMVPARAGLADLSCGSEKPDGKGLAGGGVPDEQLVACLQVRVEKLVRRDRSVRDVRFGQVRALLKAPQASRRGRDQGDRDALGRPLRFPSEAAGLRRSCRSRYRKLHGAAQLLDIYRTYIYCAFSLIQSSPYRLNSIYTTVIF